MPTDAGRTGSQTRSRSFSWKRRSHPTRAASLILTLALMLGLSSSHAHAFTVSPILNSFGDQGATTALSEISRNGRRDGIAGDLFFITINLLEPATLTLGATNIVGSPFVQCCFQISSIRLTDGDGNFIKFGTNSFSQNPFTQPIQFLLEATGLSAGEYAVAVSGTGNTDTQRLGNWAPSDDFTVRLLTAQVPEPGTAMLLGLGLLSTSAFRRRRFPPT